jgi:riboflavin synthase alpha subunit
MRIKAVAGLLVIALLITGVGVAVAAPATAPRGNALVGDVTAINGNTLTVQTLQRGQFQVQTDAQTQFVTKDNATITLSDIKVGNRIMARGSWSGNVLQAQLIALAPADLRDLVAGRVASINGSTLVVTRRDGSNVNVVTSADTRFRSPDSLTPALANIKVGDAVEAAGVLNGDTLTAGQVNFRTLRKPNSPITLGQINTIEGNSLTLKLPFGETLTVNTTATTLVVERGQGGAQVGSLSDLTASEGVMVIGTRSEDGGSITALVIVVGRGKRANSNQPGLRAPQNGQPFIAPQPQPSFSQQG